MQKLDLHSHGDWSCQVIWKEQNLKKHKPHMLHNFCKSTVESVLTCCIAAWFGNSTALDKKALQIRLAQKITGTDLPSLLDIYNKNIWNWASNIINDSQFLHPHEGCEEFPEHSQDVLCTVRIMSCLMFICLSLGSLLTLCIIFLSHSDVKVFILLAYLYLAD